MTLIEPPSETTTTPARAGPTAPARTMPAGPAIPASIPEVVAPSPRRPPSRWRQLAIVAAAAAIVVLGLAVVPKLVRPIAEQAPEATKPATGTFRPTAAQWAGLKFQTVTRWRFVPSG
jgi:ferric-dicitrate binding protein FerR (iron transport regulator)